MFGIGEGELVIIAVFAFLLFGPDKLPGMGRTLGRVLRQFREASDGFTEVVQTNIMDPAAEELEKSPKQRKREAAAELDADIAVETSEGEEGAAVAHRETFAERRARLAAERAAREEAAAAEAAADEDGTDDGVPAAAQDAATADEASASQDASQSATEGADEASDDKPAPTSAADLYALGSRKSSRTRAAEAAKEAAEPADEDAGEEDGSAQA